MIGYSNMKKNLFPPIKEWLVASALDSKKVGLMVDKQVLNKNLLKCTKIVTVSHFFNVINGFPV